LWERIEVRGITPIPAFPLKEGRGLGSIQAIVAILFDSALTDY